MYQRDDEPREKSKSAKAFGKKNIKALSALKKFAVKKDKKKDDGNEESATPPPAGVKCRISTEPQSLLTQVLDVAQMAEVQAAAKELRKVYSKKVTDRLCLLMRTTLKQLGKHFQVSSL